MTQKQQQSPHRRYSPEEISEIARLIAEGHSTRAIGKALGRNGSSISNAATRYGLARPDGWNTEHGFSRRFSDKETAQIKVLWFSGIPARQIGKSFGRSKNSIISLANRLKWPARATKTATAFGNRGEEEYTAPVTLAKLSWMGGTDGRGYTHAE